MSAVATPPVRRLGALRDVGSGIAAVGVKELRGRMRGRRAFVVLTIHLLVVAGFAWMIETITERSMSGGFSGSMSASADIGRTLFSSLIFLLTLIVLVLAPASTAGAISLEREKQTLDLLTTTPISSLAIILGKLLSALSWCSCSCWRRSPPRSRSPSAASGRGLVRAYVVLFATAIVRSMGLLCPLRQRTQAATVINLRMTIATRGTFVFVFWS